MSSSATNPNTDRDPHEPPNIPTSISNPSKPTNEPKPGSSKTEFGSEQDPDHQHQSPAPQSPRSSQASQDTERDPRGDLPPSLSPDHNAEHQRERERGHERQTTEPTDLNLNLREQLEPFDWEALEARFVVQIEECEHEEERIGEEFKGWVELFKVWSSSTAQVHGGERARKRLRTRITSVQNAEQQFEEKRQHYIKVVQAFESALALLGGL